MRRRLFAVLAAAALVAGVGVPAGASGSTTATYEVTITNVNATQGFTPPVVATHSNGFDLLQRGHAASFELQEIAENGNVTPLVDALEASPHVRDVVVAATAAGPLGPGESVTITIEADKYAHRLLMAAMLICTNDGFKAFDGVALPPMVGHTRTVRTVSLDAGTEINTEDFADIVPPCQALNGVSSDDAGTGATNPALAENSVIKRHRGITGIDDLTHGWNIRRPVASISITRTG